MRCTNEANADDVDNVMLHATTKPTVFKFVFSYYYNIIIWYVSACLCMHDM